MDGKWYDGSLFEKRWYIEEKEEGKFQLGRQIVGLNVGHGDNKLQLIRKPRKVLTINT